MTVVDTFDVVVLGTGAAALTAAVRAHEGGAGGTLGPAMVFGYLAGRHAAGQNTGGHDVEPTPA